MLALFCSCKKDKEIILEGKWNFVRKVQKAYSQNGSLIYENSIGGNPGDYYEFTKDSPGLPTGTGLLITLVNNNRDSFLYARSGDSLAVIKSITDPQLYIFDTKMNPVITLKKQAAFPSAGSGAYETTYINLSK